MQITHYLIAKTLRKHKTYVAYLQKKGFVFKMHLPAIKGKNNKNRPFHRRNRRL